MFAPRTADVSDLSGLPVTGSVNAPRNCTTAAVPPPPGSLAAIIMEDDSNQFIVEDVSKIINETIEATIGGNSYQQERVNQWSATVSEQCLNALSKLKKAFKYVVTCSIMQKTGAGLHTASSCYWDSATDGTCTVRWENKTMYCIVSVFGLAI